MLLPPILLSPLLIPRTGLLARVMAQIKLVASIVLIALEDQGLGITLLRVGGSGRCE